MIEPLLRPRPLLEHGPPLERWEAVDDEPQRLAGGVRVDRADAYGSSPPIIATWSRRAWSLIGCRPVRAFYSDHFVLPLPEGHASRWRSTPAARAHARRRHRRRQSGSSRRRRPAGTTCVLVHTPDYVDAVATGTLPREAQRRIGFPWSPAWSNVATVGRRHHRRRARGARGRRRGQPRRRHPPRLRRSRRGLLRVQRRRGRARVLQRDHAVGTASRSSTATCTRATAPRRSSATIRRCSRFRCTARRTSRSARKRATST